MGCKYCFARFNDVANKSLTRGGLPKEDALAVVCALAYFGFEKITFAGGEPTLYPWLTDVIELAKNKGMTTMLVTNGSRLNEAFCLRHAGLLDWITVSIDSLSVGTNLAIGRAKHGNQVFAREDYEVMAAMIHDYSYRLKINTVVSRYNHEEDMNDFIAHAEPERWKVFQALPIIEENDEYLKEFEITAEEFQQFLGRHGSQAKLVKENNDEMRGSYAMVDPKGCFFTNVNGRLEASSPILTVGCDAALREMNYDLTKFHDRGGRYAW